VNVCFCEEIQKVGLFAYHLEGFRVPQFVHRRDKEINWFGAWLTFSLWCWCVDEDYVNCYLTAQ